MAATSSAAVSYLRPRVNITASAGTTSPATSYLPIRTVSGLYSTPGVNARVNDLGRRPSMPLRDVKVLEENGQMSDAWWRFLSYQWSTKVGGVTQTPLPDVEAAITLSQVRSIVDEATSAGFNQMLISNAAVLVAIKEVLRTAALAGAEQIPPVQVIPATSGEGGSSSD